MANTELNEPLLMENENRYTMFQYKPKHMGNV